MGGLLWLRLGNSNRLSYFHGRTLLRFPPRRQQRHVRRNSESRPRSLKIFGRLPAPFFEGSRQRKTGRSILTRKTPATCKETLRSKGYGVFCLDLRRKLVFVSRANKRHCEVRDLLGQCGLAVVKKNLLTLAKIRTGSWCFSWQSLTMPSFSAVCWTKILAGNRTEIDYDNRPLSQ